MSGQIEVVPYDPKWPMIFTNEAQLIKKALGENCVAIHHVGSTAVPGLAAKPKIDIIAAVNDPSDIITKLEKVGYASRGEYNIPFHYGFAKRGTDASVNPHVYEEGNPEVTLNLLFRNYLRTHPQALEEYARLKFALIEEELSHKKSGLLFKRYTLGKDAFIKKVLKQAGFYGLCMRFCTHHEEIAAAKTFRNKHFETAGRRDDFGVTLDQKNHIHFILYQGVDIIGYAHLHVIEEQQAIVRILMLSAADPQEYLKDRFLNLCETWLKQKGFKKIQTNDY